MATAQSNTGTHGGQYPALLHFLLPVSSAGFPRTGGLFFHFRGFCPPVFLERADCFSLSAVSVRRFTSNGRTVLLFPRFLSASFPRMGGLFCSFRGFCPPVFLERADCFSLSAVSVRRFSLNGRTVFPFPRFLSAASPRLGGLYSAFRGFVRLFLLGKANYYAPSKKLYLS